MLTWRKEPREYLPRRKLEEADKYGKFIERGNIVGLGEI
jgi:hypothetical protein